MVGLIVKVMIKNQFKPLSAIFTITSEQRWHVVAPGSRLNTGASTAWCGLCVQ